MVSSNLAQVNQINRYLHLYIFPFLPCLLASDMYKHTKSLHLRSYQRLLSDHQRFSCPKMANKRCRCSLIFEISNGIKVKKTENLKLARKCPFSVEEKGQHHSSLTGCIVNHLFTHTGCCIEWLRWAAGGSVCSQLSHRETKQIWHWQWRCREATACPRSDCPTLVSCWCDCRTGGHRASSAAGTQSWCIPASSNTNTQGQNINAESWAEQII